MKKDLQRLILFFCLIGTGSLAGMSDLNLSINSDNPLTIVSSENASECPTITGGQGQFTVTGYQIKKVSVSTASGETVYCQNNCLDNSAYQFVGGTCCLLYTSPSPRDKRQSRMPSSA